MDVKLMLTILTTISISDVYSYFLHPKLRCVPTSTAYGPCHNCICGAEGIFHCLGKPCEEVTTNTTNDYHIQHENLPVIKDGQKCVPGKIYKKNCNTCQCENDMTLICTQMACAKDINEYHQVFGQHQGKLRNSKQKSNMLPKKCEPGKFYILKNGRTCFCTNKLKPICTHEKKTETLTPEDVTYLTIKYTTSSLPSLPHAASRCEPGMKYQVDCNTCLCSTENNLVCTKMLCASPKGMYKLNANKKSGRACVDGKPIEQDLKCVTCTCVNGRSKCGVDEICASDHRRSLHGDFPNVKPKLSLQSKGEDECTADSVYKDDCNNCYCQEDGTLRCTMKTCLNYRQALRLKQERLYLEKHGL